MNQGEIAARVKARREALGMSQVELARELGWQKMAVSRLEGLKVPIKLSHVDALSVALDVSSAWLLGLSHEEQSDPDVVAVVRRARRLDPDKRARIVDELRRFRRSCAVTGSVPLHILAA